MGGFEHAAAKSARATILEQARTLIAQEAAAEAEGAKKETAPADPCACGQCGKLVKPEHAFVIKWSGSKADERSVSYYVEHQNCDSTRVPEIAGKSITFAPQGF